jgi:hypothetical protein
MNRQQQSIPDPDQRSELNTAIATDGIDSGFWDGTGRPAPWPDDIDDWRPSTSARGGLHI